MGRKMRLEKYSKIESTNIDYKEKVEKNRKRRLSFNGCS